jgi:hypothetical protein
MASFKELHEDGWGENKRYTYHSKRFKLGKTNLGKLKEYSYRGSTPEIIFGEGREQLYKVQPNNNGTLKIIDMKNTGSGKESVEDNFIELSGGGKNIRKTKRKMNKKRKSNKRR